MISDNGMIAGMGEDTVPLLSSMAMDSAKDAVAALASSLLMSVAMDAAEDAMAALAYEEEVSNSGGGQKKRKQRMSMSDDDLLIYFQEWLEGKKECMNNLCTCLSILKNPSAASVVAQYLVWFDKKSKYDQDTLILEWYKYAQTNNDVF